MPAQPALFGFLSSQAVHSVGQAGARSVSHTQANLSPSELFLIPPLAADRRRTQQAGAAGPDCATAAPAPIPTILDRTSYCNQ